ncbi:MAG: hypothetical protein COU51_04275, partial [Parcubacteria group bacterium CG10_big_fil_rev_8_21_14_0_10_36_14]
MYFILCAGGKKNMGFWEKIFGKSEEAPQEKGPSSEKEDKTSDKSSEEVAEDASGEEDPKQMEMSAPDEDAGTEEEVPVESTEDTSSEDDSA